MRTRSFALNTLPHLIRSRRVVLGGVLGVLLVSLQPTSSLARIVGVGFVALGLGVTGLRWQTTYESLTLWLCALAMASLVGASSHPREEMVGGLVVAGALWAVWRALPLFFQTLPVTRPPLPFWVWQLTWIVWGGGLVLAGAQVLGLLGIPHPVVQRAVCIGLILSMGLLAVLLGRLQRLLRFDLDGWARVSGVVRACAGIVLLGGVCAGCGYETPARLARLGVVWMSWVIVSSAWEESSAKVFRCGTRLGIRTAASGILAVWVYACSRWMSVSSGQITLLGGGILAFLCGIVWLETRAQTGMERWTQAYQRGLEALSGAAPHEAAQNVLSAVQRALDLRCSPSLWLLYPLRHLTIDTAGYLSMRTDALPEGLVARVSRLPEVTLWHAHPQHWVRHPELRPLAQWMKEQEFRLVSLVMRHGEVEGVLAIPQGEGDPPVTCEEIRGCKKLADGLASVCYTQTILARALSIEHEGEGRVSAAEQRAADLQQRVTQWQEAGLEWVRESLEEIRGGEAPALRIALAALQEGIHQGHPLAVEVPAGVDPTPWLAQMHHAGAHSTCPFVCIRRGDAQSEARWKSPETSPLAHAQGGLLMVLNVATLSMRVQRVLGCALLERRFPWDRSTPLSLHVVVTSVVPFAALMREKRLEKSLVQALSPSLFSPISLPTLAERSEDLAMLLQRSIEREGLRVVGRPLSVAPAALELLINHPFFGGEPELVLLVQRLVQVTHGEQVEREVVECTLHALQTLYASRS